MKLILITFLISAFNVLAQPSATMSGLPPACVGNQTFLTFTGSNGTAPYTFTYNIDGGTPQTITTISGNSVTLTIDNWMVGSFVYYLVSVEDATLASQTLSGSTLSVVNPNPIIFLGPNQVVCEGVEVVCTPQGAMTYSFSPNNITSGVPFMPVNGMNINVFGADMNGCFGTGQMTITVDPLPTISSTIIDSALCNNGGITLVQDPGTINYSYSWMNGSNTPFIDNLAAGIYSVAILDNLTGCSNTLSYEVPLSSYSGNCAEITGSVFFDFDQDCQIGSGDSPIQYRMVEANPGNYLAVTDQNGNYSFQLPLGNYTVQEVFNNQASGIYCTPNYNVPLVNLSDSIGGNNFLDTLIGDIDLQATIYTTPIAPGFNFIVMPSFSNLSSGGTLMNANAWFTYPSQWVTLLSWSYPHTISNDTVYFTLNTANLFNSQIIFNATNVNLGWSIPFCSGIEIANGEVEINNNSYCQQSFVMGSFDPNDKTTYLNGIQSDSTILLTDQTLDYVIRFQNTGTAPAQDIYVLDTISANLDLSSFQFVASSHNCTVSILEGNVLKFNFPQIMLPDSTNNEPMSHGFIHYNMRQSNQNTLGTVINNTAYIYFDFNAAVVTNTTYDSIVVDDLGIDEVGVFNVKLFPNPTQSILNIGSESIIEAISIYTANGQLVKQLSPFSKESKVDLSELNQGIYLVELNSETGRIVKRIIVQ